jgi:hypothetical protein
VIDRGETTERAAYLAYAATAARPYARSTFALMLNRSNAMVDEPNLESESESDGGALDRWRERSPVKPRILSLSAGGGLRVKAGALIAFDGPLTLTYSPASKPPLAIVLSAAGGFVSIEAIRFCARAGAAVVALDRAHGFLSLMSGAPKASAATLRMQVRAEPMPIARAIVAAKIDALRQAGALTCAEQSPRRSTAQQPSIKSAISKRRLRASHGRARPCFVGKVGRFRPTGAPHGLCAHGSTPRASEARATRSTPC